MLRVLMVLGAMAAFLARAAEPAAAVEVSCSQNETGESVYRIKGKAHTIEDLATVLPKLAAGTEKPTLRLVVARDVPMSQVMKLVGVGRKAGFAGVTISAPNGMPPALATKIQEARQKTQAVTATKARRTEKSAEKTEKGDGDGKKQETAP